MPQTLSLASPAVADTQYGNCLSPIHSATAVQLPVPVDISSDARLLLEAFASCVTTGRALIAHDVRVGLGWSRNRYRVVSSEVRRAGLCRTTRLLCGCTQTQVKLPLLPKAGQHD